MEEAVKVALEAYDSSRGSRNTVLFVDRDEELSKAISSHDITSVSRTLADTGFDPNDLWLAESRMFRFAVISALREASDLYRVMCLAARTVDVGGVLLVPSQGSALKDRARDAASEIFLGAYPEFQWAVTRSNALILRRLA